MVMINRRSFLDRAGALGMGAAASTLATAGVSSATADAVSGYKALVCLFLVGGMDHLDTVMPYDAPSFDKLALLRQGLHAAHGASRARTNLLPLNPLNESVLEGRALALAPALPNLHRLFGQRDLAILGGVGPLVEPVRRADIERASARLPRRLYSHNDQQSTWMALDVEGARFGWGGRFADAATRRVSSNRAAFSAISTGGSTVFLSGQDTRQFTLGADGAPVVNVLDRNFIIPPVVSDPELGNRVRAHLAAAGQTSTNPFVQDHIDMRARAMDLNDRFQDLWSLRTPLNTRFPETRLGAQLRVIAETIQLQPVIGAPRQVFFAQQGGFDTHSNQARDVTRLHRDLDNAVGAFVAALREIGMFDNVTLFTASDFGRTLNENGNGTDHGWAGTQFIVGGAVRGGRLFGNFPQLDAASEWFTPQGAREIPSISIEQMASTLGLWFGLSAAERRNALPSLNRFNSIDLGFMTV